MLDLLVRYAQDHGMVPEAGFAAKTVRWAIVCDAAGRFLGEVIDLRDTDEKHSRGRVFRRCPDLTFTELKAGGTRHRCHFLVETAQVVALYRAEPGDAKTHNKHRFFVDLLRQASEPQERLAMIASMLGENTALDRIQAALDARKARPTDKVTFYIEGDGFPVESDAVQAWWRNARLQFAANRAPRGAMHCLATGNLVEPLPTHPKVRGLDRRAGGSPFDTLVSFDKAAFRSYGLEQSANAALSEEAAYAYRDALEDLLANHAHLIAGVQVVHWFARRVPPEDDPMPWLAGVLPDDQQERSAQHRAAQLLESIRSGKRADLRDNHYYALTLSGASRRIMVRDWMEGQFPELVESVVAWFSDLEITNLSGLRPATGPGIERAVTSLLLPRGARQDYEDWVKPVGADRLHLWHAALRKGTPIPHSALARLVGLNSRFHQTGQLEAALERKPEDAERIRTVSLLYARMGLMKAYHRRKRGGLPMEPFLNEGHPHPAYHCGRLMAVYADLQYAAQGDVGANVVQRYYAAASATPGLILGRLARLSKFHLGKLDPGLAHWYDSRIASICACIRDSLPTTLTLQEQSLFALGYYHQLAEDNARKSKNPKQDNGRITNEEESNG